MPQSIWFALVFWTMIAVDHLCAGEPAASAPVFGYRVLASYPHDPTAFTQGLAYASGQLFEGTGNYGRSSLRRVDLTTGHVDQEIRLAPHLFGEGVTVWQGRLIQLTWREHLGLIYGVPDLDRQDSFGYSGEGWGITHDGQQWFLSDGTPMLRVLNPVSRQVVRRILVQDAGQPIAALNELEWINGEIWANVWKTDRIVRIAPDSGRVIAWVDLRGLCPASMRPNAEAVLNGIAYDAEHGRLFVTGKDWPRLYQIEVVPKPQ